MSTPASAGDTPIAEVMQRNVRSIGMDDSTACAEAFLNSQQLSWAPVVDSGGQPIGVLSVDDLMRFRVQAAPSQPTPVWRLCTYRPVAVAPHTTVAEVARLMLERKFHHVVVTDQGVMVGVASSLDLLRLLR